MGIMRKFTEMSSLGASSATFTKFSIPDGMPDKVKSIMEKFEEISNDRMRLQLREEDGPRQTSSVHHRPPSSSHMNERAIFGRELEKEEITKILSPSNGPDFMVLPIVGMGGLGKTTLAQLVYNDLSFYGLFQKRAWVSVSDDFDLVRLTRAIIESITQTACVVSELSTLHDTLKEEIKDRTLLLILDDVWNDDRNVWDGFRVAFSCAKTVRILITTRNTLSASIMQTTTSAYHLQGLPEEKCWLLFRHYAFNDEEDSEHMNLLEISHAIVEKCKGSPLAVKALGGILRDENDENKWKELLESDIWQINENNDVMLALRLSYKKLPVRLRPCFLYLSLFPKGTPFEKENIVRLWMAQGYINGNTRTGKTLEEIGSEYFDELHGRSLIIDSSHPNEYCLHDLVHDLIRSISQETNLPNVGNNQQREISYISRVDSNYHLYLTQFILSESLASCNKRAIRTLIMYWPRVCETYYYSEDYTLDSAFSEIPCLRALQLGCSELPKTVGTLKHLRYLSVHSKHLRYLSVHSEMIEMHHEFLHPPFKRRTGEKKLFESLCLLFNLQSLILDFSSMSALPKNISNLVNLRFLWITNGLIKQLPESVCTLHNLDTIKIENCKYFCKLPRGTEQLTNLHNLELIHCRIIELPSGIGKLTNLRTLRGRFIVMGDAITGGLGELKDMNRLSGSLWISGLQNIADVEYSRNVNLESKSNLNTLILNIENENEQNREQVWNYFRYPNYDEFGSLGHLLHIIVESRTIKYDKKIEDRVLESFKPHGNLKKLLMCNFEGRVFPSWLFDSSVLSKLTDLQLYLKTKFACLPPSLGKFPHLIHLSIWAGAYFEEYYPDHFSKFLSESYSWKKPAKTSISSPNFASLEMLELKNMLNWVECQVHVGDIPSLKNLRIDNCPKLRNLPVIPVQIVELRINNCGCEEIKFSSKCKLRTISLSGCPKLLTFLATLEELVVLEISDCGFREINLSSLFNITKISISNCRELVTVHYRNGDLPALREISLEGCPKLLAFSKMQEEHQQLDIGDFGFQEIKSSSEPLNLDPILDVSNRISLFNCPKLKIFSASLGNKGLKIQYCGFRDIRISSMYEQVEISNCLYLMTIQWKDEGLNYRPDKTAIVISCPDLQLLEVTKEIVKLTIHSCGIHEVNFPSESKMRTIYISDCPELSSINWVDGGLGSLKQVRLCNCAKLKIPRIPKVVMEMDLVNCSINEIIFPSQSQIATVNISNCPELFGVLKLPEGLKNLKVSSCGIDKILFPKQYNMDCVRIFRCPNLLSVHWKYVTPVVPKETHKLEITDSGPQKIQSFEQCKIGFVRISDCPELISLNLRKGEQPSIKQLFIVSCSKFCEALTVPNEMEILGIEDCNVPQLSLLLQSNLLELSISKCAELTAIDGKVLLNKVCISHCPLLQFPLDGVLHRLIEILQIHDCPRLALGSNYNYQRETTSKKMELLGDERIHLVHDSGKRSIRLFEGSVTLIFTNEVPLQVGPLSYQCIILNLPLLVGISIRNCSKVLSISGLDNLHNLKYIFIKGCRELCNWNDTVMPLSLQSLQLHSCEKLSSLPVLSTECHSSTLEVIINNCPLARNWCLRNNIKYSEEPMSIDDCNVEIMR